jgi:hypothetical protein
LAQMSRLDEPPRRHVDGHGQVDEAGDGCGLGACVAGRDAAHRGGGRRDVVEDDLGPAEKLTQGGGVDFDMGWKLVVLQHTDCGMRFSGYVYAVSTGLIENVVPAAP